MLSVLIFLDFFLARKTGTMVTLTKIYTRGGDKGKTSLGSGDRVEKHHLRVEAYGTVDEANAVVGLVRLSTASDEGDGRRSSLADAMLARIQNDLFDLGADLCLPSPADEESRDPDWALRMVAAQVERLEQEIDLMNASLAPLRSFVLPGGCPAAAQLHLARTVIRRAERLIAALSDTESVNPHALAYANRLSDHFFVMARWLNEEAQGDVLWVPGAHRLSP